MKIYTIGFTQKRAEQFFGLLRENNIQRLIDIRLHPGGQLAGFAKQDDLPFALVEFDLSKPDPQPPHTEDYSYHPDSPTFIRIVHDRKSVLNWSLFKDVQDIFEQPIHDDFGYYVMDCQGPRSIGTIEPTAITNVIYEKGPEGVWDYRIWFYDQNQHYYRLKIVDLTWHYYCDSLRNEHHDPSQIAKDLNGKLTNSQVYLRIGLSRGWDKFPERCYLQITAIYTFPDYLEEKIFVDYSPKRDRG